MLLSEIEGYFPDKRYELFTSTRSLDNIRLYQKLGYTIFTRKVMNDELEFVYMEKNGNDGVWGLESTWQTQQGRI